MSPPRIVFTIKRRSDFKCQKWDIVFIPSKNISSFWIFHGSNAHPPSIKQESINVWELMRPVDRPVEEEYCTILVPYGILAAQQSWVASVLFQWALAKRCFRITFTYGSYASVDGTVSRVPKHWFLEVFLSPAVIHTTESGMFLMCLRGLKITAMHYWFSAMSSAHGETLCVIFWYYGL